MNETIQYFFPNSDNVKMMEAQGMHVCRNKLERVLPCLTFPLHQAYYILCITAKESGAVSIGRLGPSRQAWRCLYPHGGNSRKNPSSWFLNPWGYNEQPATPISSI